MAARTILLRGLLAGFCLAVLAGCVSTTDPYDVASKTTVTLDPYDGLWKARGPLIIAFGVRDISNYRLRAWSRGRDFGSASKAQLYVEARPDEWLYLNSAHSGGVAFDVTKIDRDVEKCDEHGCKFSEVVGINMSIDQLRAIARLPAFNVRLSGRRGNLYLTVPGTYFQGFLLAMGQARG